MPAWIKAVLRTIGTLNAGCAALGVCLLLSSIRVLFTVGRHTEFPYFRIAFVVMRVLHDAFLGLFLLAAFQLLRPREAGVVRACDNIRAAHWVLRGNRYALACGLRDWE
jgi:hypothetical protein